MSQQLRTFIYYVLIGAVVVALIHFFPFPFQPSNWQIAEHEELIITDIDSSLLVQSEAQDTSLTETDTLKSTDHLQLKDTVTTNHYLSCPPAFLKQLGCLYEQLKSVSANSKHLRILHYGDSQIEGDRITAYLRETFQKRFGGSGPGLTAVFDPVHINPSVWVESKGNWQMCNIYDRRSQLTSQDYGLMGQAAVLKANTRGEFKISSSRWAEKHASYYQKVRLFIAPHVDTISIKGQISGVEIINDSLQPSEDLTEINWEFEQLSPAIRFELFSNSDINILGCALDSLAGVSVDNIALRGQSTPLLHRTSGDLYKAMGEQLNIELIIFQFGTNMIPTIAPNYRFYQIQLSRQFELIKEYLPNVPVLVVGISDAAQATDGQIQSYDHLPRINEAQKALALQYEFAFFDLYNAMGGEGSIIEWADKTPPWALTDYIHLSRTGGQKAAELITNALWHQFDKFEATDTCLLTQADTLWQSY
ncbi:GDSL-type esterase/lipase family protein [Carboxylicivirga taeanensis]|uniref:GDSL-type esterase/lipase family protein n=1 Tax=Carboxylicivirga taeanensis TaxID=1416875 RepID=UPI003F6DB493